MMSEYSDIKSDINVNEDTAPDKVAKGSESLEVGAADEMVTSDGEIGIELSEVDRLKLELEDAKNRSLRALADLENFRVRTNRQIVEERKYASIDLMRELLAVWDNIGRALDAVNKTQSLELLVEGVKMVHQQFLDVLAKYNCVKIDAIHQPFDPNFHASVAQLPSEEFPVNTVIDEVLTGFRLYDRVVRPTQVVLSSAKQPQ
ncbi:MAG: nucleotide exchange factor GrpE [Planctomycetaceae bacterium]|jgi:molecular chaperone GrpE|nr:nucleotide exchange factor GrpE [Planctomycetaceae bacterium]